MLIAWGANNMGQCCAGEEGAETEWRPRCVNRAVSRSLSTSSVVSVASGEQHTLVLTSTGDVFACGRSQEGQLGIDIASKQGTFARHSKELVRVDSLKSWRIAQIACGSKHSIAITQTGRAFEWGFLLPLDASNNNKDEGASQRLRGGYGTDFQEDLDERQRRIVASSWGQYLTNSNGDDAEIDCEDAMTMMKRMDMRRFRISHPRPADGFNDKRARAVACGWAHTVVAVDDGSLYASGYNEKGQLGNGSRVQSGRFQNVSLPVGATAIAGCCETVSSTFSTLACGLNHTAAITSEKRQLLTWGLGVFGQLGLGQAKKETCIPGVVNFDVDVAQVACGDQHTLALTVDGNVHAFGHKDAVGGSSHRERRPEIRPELSVGSGKQVGTLFAGGMGCFATVDSDALGFPRILHSWGYNQNFALGRICPHEAFMRPGPTALPWLPGADVADLSAGSTHCIALMKAPSTSVLPPEIGNAILGNPSLLRMLNGDVSFDVSVQVKGFDGAKILGAHRCILKARAPQLASRLQPSGQTADRPWKLDLEPTSITAAAALLEYIYCDYTKASPASASELRPLAEELGLQRLIEGIVAATETDSQGEEMRWVRSATGKWVQVETSRTCEAARTESTYAKDLASLVFDDDLLDDTPLEPSFVQLRIRSMDGAESQGVRIAKALLLTVEFFEGLLERDFLEARCLRNSGNTVEIAADDVDAFILCLKSLACCSIGDIMPASPLQVLAVLGEAHRLELQRVVVACEWALGRALNSPDADLTNDEDVLQAVEGAAALYELPRLSAEVVIV